MEYAREELRVEISAMLTGDWVGVGHDGSRGAAYVQGWITALDPRPPMPVDADPGPRADDRQPEGDPQPRRARRSRAGDTMTSRSAQVDTSPESPATVPTLPDRAGQLAPLGWTGREAEWLALVALHSGAFTRAQCGVYFQAGDDRKRLLRFVRALIEKHLAIEDERPIFPGGARAVLLTGKPIYQALGIPDVRHHRSKAATTIVLLRRLLSLDYLIARPTVGWLPIEGDEVQRFEALGLDRRTFPYRLSGPAGTPPPPRSFAFTLPIAVNDHAATFVYVDPGQSTDSELRAWVWPTRPCGPHFGRGLSPCRSPRLASAQRRQTAPRPCSNTGPRTATARA